MSGIDDLAGALSGDDGPESGGDDFAVLETASIVQITQGAARDNKPLITVSWRGSNVTAAYLRDVYDNVTVGDLVLIGHHGNIPYILGPLDGLPA